MLIASPSEYFYVDNLVFIQVNSAKLKIFAFGSCLTYYHHSIVKDKRLLCTNGSCLCIKWNFGTTYTKHQNIWEKSNAAPIPDKV